jgi:predicted enzyme related to lactoylglutathione lyase
MQNNPVIWFELYVEDMERARKFYETVFNWSLTKIESPDIEMWGFPMEQDKVGAGGALVKMEGVSPGGGGTLVYFMCADCAVEAKKFAGNGGKICREKFSIGPYGYIALVSDCEGNMVGLHSMS